jgi:glyoxylase-like metal-dependent hydrolase (beta-lactamase superfamily II)
MEPTALSPILDGVWRWSVWNAPRALWFNGHLIRVGQVGRVGDIAVLIDPVPLSPGVADAIASTASTATSWLCVVTNRDHERAAADVQTRFGARLLASRGDAGQMSSRVDDVVDHGDLIAGELQVIRVANAKTPGEIALHWPARRLVVLGDAALGRPAGSLSMLPDEKFADATAAREGVARLAALGVEIVLVGDGDDILAGGTNALASLGGGPARAPGPGGGPGC